MNIFAVLLPIRYYLFFLAVENDWLDIVNRSLERTGYGYIHGVDPSLFDDYAIAIASQNGFVDVVDRLLQDDRVSPVTGSDRDPLIQSRMVIWQLLSDY